MPPYIPMPYWPHGLGPAPGPDLWHGGEPTIDATMVKDSNKLRGNSHWTSTYMPLQENLGGEVGKGVLTGRGASMAARTPTGSRCR
jgi:hypothetical protein